MSSQNKFVVVAGGGCAPCPLFVWKITMFHVKHFTERNGKEMITRNGICYDLEMSSYRVKIDGLTFVFSSKMHKEKFINKHKEHREKINISLSRRFNYDVNVDKLADIVFYRKIENRGFLIIDNEGNKLWQNNIIFGGGVVTMRNSHT